MVPMIALINDNRTAIDQLCRRFHVARLDLFGSAAEGPFDQTSSDVDFLVEFETGHDLGPWLGQYFDFKDELERLLGRSVDLVMAGAMRNPHFIREVNRTRCPLYAR